MRKTLRRKVYSKKWKVKMKCTNMENYSWGTKLQKFVTKSRSKNKRKKKVSFKETLPGEVKGKGRKKSFTLSLSLFLKSIYHESAIVINNFYIKNLFLCFLSRNHIFYLSLWFFSG